MELGELDDLFEAAALGELEDSADWSTKISAIRRDPDIYELRRRSGRKKLRFYHGEPPRFPNLLVKLHKQIKVDKASQDLAVSVAVVRYRGGDQRDWT